MVGFLDRLKKRPAPEISGCGLSLWAGDLSVNGRLLGSDQQEQLTSALGPPRRSKDRGSTRLIWDNLGLMASVESDGSLNHVWLRLEPQAESRPDLPSRAFAGSILIDGRPLAEAVKDPEGLSAHVDPYQAVYAIASADFEHRWTVHCIGQAPSFTVVMLRPPKRKEAQSEEDYAHAPVADPAVFSSLNLKLLVIDRLMYWDRAMRPAFDLAEYAWIKSRAVVTERDDVSDSPEAVEWFRSCPVPKGMAASIEELVFDGGNEVYMNICSNWDGEDDRYDVTSITEADLDLLPSLKSVIGLKHTLDAGSKALLTSRGIKF